MPSLDHVVFPVRDAEASLPYLIDAINRAVTSERKAQNTARAARFADAWTKRRQNDIATAGFGWDASPISLPRMYAEVHNLVKNDAFSIAFETSSEYEERYELRLQLAWSAIKAGDHDSAVGLFASKYPLTDSSKTPPEQLRLETWIALGFEDPRSAEYAAETALRNAVTPA